MKKTPLLISLILFAFSLHGQYRTLDSIGYTHYLFGSNELELGNYKAADSLLTIALCSYKNENVYFNRAVAKLYLGDTIGFCNDVNIVANKYYDKEGAKLFQNYCCSRVDSIFFNKKLLRTNDKNFRYYEVIRYLKYDSLAYGTLHDVNHSEPIIAFEFGCNNNPLGFNTSHTDIIAAYEIMDKRKYYYLTEKPISIIRQEDFENLKERASTYLATKYNYLKEGDNNKKLEVHYAIYINADGLIDEIDYLGFFPSISPDMDLNDLEKDLLDIARNFPRVRPARFRNSKVNSLIYDYIEF